VSVGYNYTIDDKAEFENKDSQNVINSLLTSTNSVLTFSLQTGTVTVSPRTASATLKAEFYGQSSYLGIEDIRDIANYSTGENRLLNLVKWKETNIVASDTTSRANYGARTRELDFQYVTDTGKRTGIANAIMTEFKDPKIEFELSTYLNVKTLPLKLLDRVRVDLPSPIVSPDDTFGFSVYDVAQYDIDSYAQEINSVVIPYTTDFKIAGITINAKDDTVKLWLREV
jgi:hypothetical protein